MKKFYLFVLASIMMLLSACHDRLWDAIDDLDARVARLEELCKEMNTNISSLQTIVSVLQENDYITGIVPVEKDGKVIGYTITFGKHAPITIYNGEDGKDGLNGTNGIDGKDGYTPILGIAKDTDGVYYWTLDGEWLLDADGNKLRVTGRDGKDGQDGQDGKDGVDGEDGKDGQDGADGKDGVDGEDGKDGQNGTNGVDGKDGVTPQLKIENNYWYISYDNGGTWTELGKAVGEDGQNGTNGTNGKDGQDGDSMFSKVTYDEKNAYLTLADGTVLTIPLGEGVWEKLEDLEERIAELEALCKEMNTNIVALQTIVAALQNNDYITGVAPITKDGKTIGYVISFAKNDPITIYNGEDGKDGANGTNGIDGKDGYTPILGVAKDTDGVYYWTLDGEWLLDAEGNKLRVTGRDGKDGVDGEDGKDGENGKDGVDGEDGKDGQDGANGTNGVDGKDGVTPQLKIENGYWYISYDKGATWTELGKAVGEDGKDGVDGEDGKDGQDGKPGADGKDGQNGDSMFTSVTYDENNVYFTLTDGSVLIIPRGNSGGAGENDPSDIIKFEDLNVKSALLQMGGIDTNKDGEISYGEAASYNGEFSMNGNTVILSFKEFQYFTGITKISRAAFSNCSSLFEIVLPNSIDSIGSNAFSSCSKLLQIKIPNNVRSISDSTFMSCKSLMFIDIPEEIKTFGVRSFANCSSLLEITIPNGITSIPKYAFQWCSSLQRITIPNGVKFIGEYAFHYCESLTYADIPNTITSIGDYAFVGCPLESFVFHKDLVDGLLPLKIYSPTKVTTVYWNITSLSSFAYDAGTYDYVGLGYIYTGGITPNSSIKQVIIADNVKKIPNYLCNYLGSLQEIIIPNSVTSIGSHAFDNCNSLASVTIGDNVTSIGSYAFSHCESLTEIIIPEKVKSIDYYAFSYCSSLKTVYVKNTTPPSLYSSYVFNNSSINKIYVPMQSVETYKAASGWSSYASKIEGYDF